MTANVLGNRCGAIEGEQNACLELGLGALDLAFGDVERQTGPFAKSEMDEIVNAGDIVGDEVDTPETIMNVSTVKLLSLWDELTQYRCSW